MTINKRPMSPDGSKQERRKSQRFQVPIPIEVSWRGLDGRAIKEAAIARQVNAQGALLEMSHYPEIGGRVTLTNFFSAKTAEARVLATPYAREGTTHGIAVELIAPSEIFWGVGLQMKKTGAELTKLEKSLQTEGIDPRLLDEYQDAVEWVRMAAQMVRELRQRQLDGQRDEDVIASLTAARIRRATNLSLNLVADLESGGIGKETKGVEELQNALEQACMRLKNLPTRKVAQAAVKGAAKSATK